MPYFKSPDGITLHYRDWGTGGSPIVFIHGNNTDASFWEYQIALAGARGIRAVAPDRRGHGRSDYVADGYDYDTYAADLAALLDHADLSRVTLVGHSTGANAIARYLRRYGTHRVAAAVLAGMVPLAPISPEDRIATEMTLQAIDATVQDRPNYFQSLKLGFFGEGACVSEESMDAWIERTYAIPLEIAAKTAAIPLDPRSDTRADLQAFDIPTLLVHGDADTFAPIASAQEAQRAIPGSRLITYEGAAHGLTISHAARFTDELFSFVDATLGAIRTPAGARG